MRLYNPRLIICQILTTGSTNISGYQNALVLGLIQEVKQMDYGQLKSIIEEAVKNTGQF